VDELLAVYDNHPGVVRIVAAAMSDLLRRPPLTTPDADELRIMIERVRGGSRSVLVLADKTTGDSTYGAGYVVYKIGADNYDAHDPGEVTGRWMRFYRRGRCWCYPGQGDDDDPDQQRWLSIPLTAGTKGPLAGSSYWIGPEFNDHFTDAHAANDGDDDDDSGPEYVNAYRDLGTLCEDLCRRSIDVVVAADGNVLFGSPCYYYELGTTDVDDIGYTIVAPSPPGHPAIRPDSA
jgi:hypothetical protein